MPHIGGARATRVDRQLVKAIAHPVRADALAILNAREASPNQIARELGLDVGNVSYHVTELARQGCVELVSTRKRRGATEHFYRGTDSRYLDDEFWTQLSGSVRGAITIASLRELIATARDSLESGLFEARADRHFSIASYDLDEQGWAEAGRLFQATLDRLMDIGSESEARVAAAGESRPTPALRASFGLLAFESPAADE